MEHGTHYLWTKLKDHGGQIHLKEDDKAQPIEIFLTSEDNPIRDRLITLSDINNINDQYLTIWVKMEQAQVKYTEKTEGKDIEKTEGKYYATFNVGEGLYKERYIVSWTQSSRSATLEKSVPCNATPVKSGSIQIIERNSIWKPRAKTNSCGQVLIYCNKEYITYQK